MVKRVKPDHPEHVNNRQGNKPVIASPRAWNRATDMVLNHVLLDGGLLDQAEWERWFFKRNRAAQRHELRHLRFQINRLRSYTERDAEEIERLEEAIIARDKAHAQEITLLRKQLAVVTQALMDEER